MQPTAADVTGLLRVLAEHDVEFLVVGGVCAVIHGAPISTFDLDIVPERSDENVARLVRALATVDAGCIDVQEADGRGRDFSNLASRSHPIEVGNGLIVRVLDLDALIDIKREVAREKDLATLPVLVRTLDERRKRDA